MKIDREDIKTVVLMIAVCSGVGAAFFFMFFG